MNVRGVEKFCASFPGTEIDEMGAPHNVLVFRVAGKHFAYFKTSDPEKWRFSIRVTPERFIELTDQAGIKPARYMQRFHWITIVHVASVDGDYLKELIGWSYNKAVSGLSSKVRAKIGA